MKSYEPVIAEPHTPPYKIHRYFARRPWNVFRKLIEVFSEEGQVVLDPFCGGGVTIYEGLQLKRKVIGYDLNPLSILIVKNMIRNSYNYQELKESCQNALEYLNYLYNDFNKITPDLKQKTLIGTRFDIQWNELAFSVKCNYCSDKVLLSNENRIKNGYYSCLNPDCKGNKKNKGYIEPRNCERISYEYLFSVYKPKIEKKHLFSPFDETRKKIVLSHVLFLKKEIDKNKINIPSDEIPINWDRQYEDLLLRKNIKTFQDFFTERNLLINLLLLNFIKKLIISKDTYEILRIIFSSSLRDTNIMAFTHDGWQAGKPTTWSKHAYWIPNQFCEVDIRPAFEKAYTRVLTALKFNEKQNYSVNHGLSPNELKSDKNIFLINGSIDDFSLPNNFVDIIITDPPYGSNVQYLELSHFWYVWNKDLYDKKDLDFSKEAVSNRKKNFKGSKSMNEYEKNLGIVFKRCYQSLKPDKRMVLTFNNKDMGAWLALLVSIFKAGFSFEKDGLYYQTGVKNYRQTAHTKYDGSPYGDFIYVFVKNDKRGKPSNPRINESEFISKIDGIFKKYLREFSELKKDKNELIINMFFEAVPKIEEYIHRNGEDTNTTNLYKHFGKHYLDKIYG